MVGSWSDMHVLDIQSVWGGGLELVSPLQQTLQGGGPGAWYRVSTHDSQGVCRQQGQVGAAAHSPPARCESPHWHPLLSP